MVLLWIRPLMLSKVPSLAQPSSMKAIHLCVSYDDTMILEPHSTSCFPDQAKVQQVHTF